MASSDRRDARYRNENCGKIKTLGIKTIGDLAKGDEHALKTLLGINGPRLKDKANGIHPAEVNPERIYEFKSVGNSSTLSHDSADWDELTGVFDRLALSVSERLQRKEVMACRLFIMIRYADWKTVTRSMTLSNPADQKKTSWKRRWNCLTGTGTKIR